MRKALVILPFLFCAPLSIASELCSAVHESRTVPAPAALKEISDSILPIYKIYNPEVGNFSLKTILIMRQKPKWNDYADLLKILESLDKHPQISMSSERFRLKNQYKEQREEIIRSFEKLSLQPQKKTEISRFVDDNYAYFELLGRINEKLGPDFIPLPKSLGLKSNQALKLEAEDFVQRLENHVRTHFKETGHESPEAFRDYLQKHGVIARKHLNLFENQVVIGMHRPESARFWIPVAGFQNQRVTGSSRGSLADEGGYSKENFRNKVEASLTKISVEDYSPISPRFKPNYATVRPSAKSPELEPTNRTGHYGTDIWVMKKSSVGKRATVSPTDSLGFGWGERMLSSELDVLIPWSMRLLMSPFGHENNNLVAPGPLPSGFTFKLGNWRDVGYGYYEVQIWGPLSINDVQAFHFQGNPPDKKLYDLLVSKGIEVFDERQWPPKPYNGGESK